MDLRSGSLMLVRDKLVKNGWKVPIWKASRDIYDSMWISECPFESIVLGQTWEGTREEDQFPVGVQEGSSHESVVLGQTWEGTGDVSEILGGQGRYSSMLVGKTEVGLMPKNLWEEDIVE